MIGAKKHFMLSNKLKEMRFPIKDFVKICMFLSMKCYHPPIYFCHFSTCFNNVEFKVDSFL